MAQPLGKIKKEFYPLPVDWIAPHEAGKGFFIVQSGEGMLNIDERIFAQVDQDEFWLLVHIAKRLNKDMTCFPSNTLLMKDTKWKIEKLQRVKKSLQESGILRIEDKFINGRQTANNYHVNTPLIGVFMGLDRIKIPPGNSDTTPENRQTPPGKTDTTPLPEKPTAEVLNSKEVLNSELFAGMSIPERVFIYFNELRHRFKFRGDIHLSKARIKTVGAWVRAGYKEQDFKHVLDLKFSKWGNDVKMREYLRPETVFGEKFPSYVEECLNQPQAEWTERAAGPVFIDKDYPY